MWKIHETGIERNCGALITIKDVSNLLSFGDFLNLVKSSSEFREFFIHYLSSTAYQAYRWETPALSKSTLGQNFQFVVIDSPYLLADPYLVSFSIQFLSSDPDSIAEFENLGGDATLLAPCPENQDIDYSHLAAFVRNAPMSLQYQLWISVGYATQR